MLAPLINVLTVSCFERHHCIVLWHSSTVFKEQVGEKQERKLAMQLAQWPMLSGWICLVGDVVMESPSCQRLAEVLEAIVELYNYVCLLAAMKGYPRPCHVTGSPKRPWSIRRTWNAVPCPSEHGKLTLMEFSLVKSQFCLPRAGWPRTRALSSGTL